MKKAIITRFRDTNEIREMRTFTKEEHLKDLDSKVKEHNNKHLSTYIEIVEDEILLEIVSFKEVEIKDNKLSEKLRNKISEIDTQVNDSIRNLEYINTLSTQLEELADDIKTNAL